MSVHEAAGSAAGYHFQIQRSLLSLLTGQETAEVAIEALDDIQVTDGSGAITTLEQLKHSVHAGSLTDRSRPLWRSLDVDGPDGR